MFLKKQQQQQQKSFMYIIIIIITFLQGQFKLLTTKLAKLQEENLRLLVSCHIAYIYACSPVHVSMADA